MDTIEWLLDADPAVRWQAMRDLADASPGEIATERSVVADLVHIAAFARDGRRSKGIRGRGGGVTA